MIKSLLVIFVLVATGSLLPSKALTECEFIERTINKLGARMAILRATIASTEDKTKQDAATAQLSQYSVDYRKAKKQIEEFQFKYPKDLDLQKIIIDKLDKIHSLCLRREEIYNNEIRNYKALKLSFLSRELKSETK